MVDKEEAEEYRHEATKKQDTRKSEVVGQEELEDNTPRRGESRVGAEVVEADSEYFASDDHVVEDAECEVSPEGADDCMGKQEEQEITVIKETNTIV